MKASVLIWRLLWAAAWSVLLYILDEPSIGLHSRDTDLLIKVLRQLQALGNTVVVVEHDEDIIRSADYIIDIGPKAGRLGGEVVYQGDVNNLQTSSDSYTVRYLTGEDKIEVPFSGACGIIISR